MNIGFIGLGIMGKPMAKNLLKAGHKLVVYDIVDASVRELVEAGATAGASPKDVASRNELIITMLPNSPHVKTAVLGKNGVIEGAKPGSVLVDREKHDEPIQATQAKAAFRTSRRPGGIAVACLDESRARCSEAGAIGGKPSAMALRSRSQQHNRIGRYTQIQPHFRQAPGLRHSHAAHRGRRAQLRSERPVGTARIASGGKVHRQENLANPAPKASL